MHSINQGVTLRPDLGLYAIPAGESYQHLPYDTAFEQTMLLADRLGQPRLAPFEAERGTLELLNKRSELLRIAASTNQLGTWFSPRTPMAVQKIIDRLIHTDERVRLFYGDLVSGLAETDEFATIGRVGRSTGPLKAPLILEDGEIGGMKICDDRIVRVVRLSDGKDLYRHRGFHVRSMKIVENEHPQYKASVLTDGCVEARFKRYEQACYWVAFMSGMTHEPPSA